MMRGCICKCDKCGKFTITTDRICEEVMKCGCGGLLKPKRECDIGVDLALECNRSAEAIPVVKHGDAIVIRTMTSIRKEDCERYAAELTGLLGEKVMVIPCKFEIVGAIENG